MGRYEKYIYIHRGENGLNKMTGQRQELWNWHQYQFNVLKGAVCWPIGQVGKGTVVTVESEASYIHPLSKWMLKFPRLTEVKAILPLPYCWGMS
jgi:hypothetical protein